MAQGLTINDLEVFQNNNIADAMELAWEAYNMEYTREKVELALEVVEVLAAAYKVAMWADANVENHLSSFDSPRPSEHQLYCRQK